MKLIIAAFVFFLTLSLTYKVSANEPKACSPGTNENCAQSKGESHGPNHGAEQGAKDNTHQEGHNDLSKKMNSLFPEKQKDPRVSTRPLQVKLESPKFLTVVSAPSVKLGWSDGAGATSYHLQVATDPNFKWLLVNEHFVKGSSYDLAKLEAGKRYFWRVASVKDDNISMFTKSLFVSSAFDTK